MARPGRIVTRRPSRFREQPGPRHSADWYDQSDEPTVLDVGDRLFIPCEGGPSASRLETFPPRLEIEEPDGTYVLVDVGPRQAWRYVFIPSRP